MPSSAVRRALFVLSCLFSACRGKAPEDANSARSADVELPGVDTREFTPREQREFARYVTEFSAPCPGKTVTVARCVTDPRDASACGSCLAAARMIAKAVREGLAREQVIDLFKVRYDPAAVKSIPLDGSPSRGPTNDAVTLVEFADFECPFCQRLAPQLDAIWEKRQSAVRFVFKYMPLAMHPHGEIAARAAIAAQAQGKFWEMHRLLFASGDRLDSSDLEGYATSLGLDVNRWRADLQAPATTARIEADRKLADALGVKGTPTLYVDGREVDLKLDLGDWLDGQIAAGSGTRPR